VEFGVEAVLLNIFGENKNLVKITKKIGNFT
jgi:hypothetical protein